MKTERKYADEVLADAMAGVMPNLSVAQRACAQVDELRAQNARLVDALKSWLDLYSEQTSGHDFHDMLENIERITHALVFLNPAEIAHTNSPAAVQSRSGDPGKEI